MQYYNKDKTAIVCKHLRNAIFALSGIFVVLLIGLITFCCAPNGLENFVYEIVVEDGFNMTNAACAAGEPHFHHTITTFIGVCMGLDFAGILACVVIYCVFVETKLSNLREIFKREKIKRRAKREARRVARMEQEVATLEELDKEFGLDKKMILDDDEENETEEEIEEAPKAKTIPTKVKVAETPAKNENQTQKSSGALLDDDDF